MKQAREVALDALTACERQGAWSDGYLKKAIGGAKLDGRDAALATRLCFGVLQNRMLLELTVEHLEQMKFCVLTHHLVPPNDGGIALGQAVYGLKRLKLQKNET